MADKLLAPLAGPSPGDMANEFLKKGFDAASRLTPQQQDAIATLLLDELEAEGPWESAFQGPAYELSKLADEALGEHRDGRTEPLAPSTM